ncbi:MAG: EAL domain-containing protein [Synergistaceae bacterium]|nr:EAL domain-containing protein [Synergistaceae bacterium]
MGKNRNETGDAGKALQVNCVIDDSYRLISVSGALRRLHPQLQLGGLCYEQLYQRQSICNACPIQKLKSEGTDAAVSQQYDAKNDSWAQAGAVKINIPDHGQCYLAYREEIGDISKETFYKSYLSQTYDLIIEANLTKNSYKFVYKIEGKYVLPSDVGDLREMLTGVADHIIHPDHLEEYWSFWDKEKLCKSLKQEKATVGLDYLAATSDGKYIWLSNIIQPTENEEGDDTLLCCILDIDEKKTLELAQQESSLAHGGTDSLTGLMDKERFCKEAQALTAAGEKGQYCMVSVDIEHFKLFNEWYGRERGDILLRELSEILRKIAGEFGGLASRFGDDDFAMLLRSDFLSETAVVEKRITEHIFCAECGVNLLPAIGVYVVEDTSAPIQTIYDRATISMDLVKGRYLNRTQIYSDNMRRSLEDDQLLLAELKHALENDEFIIYLQPKCSIRTGKIVGSEALARWKHPTRGIVGPGDFIPFMERAGMIFEIDVRVWEATCRVLRSWIDAGIEPLPVSVNVSRADIYNRDLISVLCGLTDKYNIPRGLLNLEVTESVYVQNEEQMLKVMRELRSLGFLILMDDFGSGYSSLHMLKEMELDIIKIDMRFLEMSQENIRRGSSIIEFVIYLAKLLGYRVIAEGVETLEQAEFLLSQNCEYAQGYYFHKPMPVSEFEKLLTDGDNVDFRGIPKEKLSHIDLSSIFAGNIPNDILMNRLLGGIAIYSLDADENLELLQVNDGYYRMTGCNPVDLYERKKYILSRQVVEEDREKVLQALREARANPMNDCGVTFRRYRLSGEIMWMYARIVFLKEVEGCAIYYASITDMTEQKEAEMKLDSSRQSMQALLKAAGISGPLKELKEEERNALLAIASGRVGCGMIGFYCEKELPVYFVNDEMLALLGYDSHRDFADRTDGGKIIALVHPDDIAGIIEAADRISEGAECTSRCRMRRKDGSWMWALACGRAVRTGEERLAIVGVCIDISEKVAAVDQLCEVTGKLKGALEQLSYFNKNNPGGYHRFADNESGDFIDISDRFCEIMGWSRDEIRDKFDNKFVNLIHPDYVGKMFGNTEESEENRPSAAPYPMFAQKGYIWVKDNPVLLSIDGKDCYCGTVLDVTDIKWVEKALRAEELGTRMLVEESGLAMWEYEPEEDRLRLCADEKSFLRSRIGLDKYTKNFKELVANSALIDKEGKEKLLRLCEGIKDDEPTLPFTLKLTDREGKRAALKISARPLPDDGLGSLGCIGVAREIQN